MSYILVADIDKNYYKIGRKININSIKNIKTTMLELVKELKGNNVYKINDNIDLTNLYVYTPDLTEIISFEIVEIV